MATDQRLDQRHHITLVSDDFREKLARVKPEVIPAYVSWAARLRIYEHYILKMEKLGGKLADGTWTDPTWKRRAESLQDKTNTLWGAWRRNLDMSIAEHGKGRSELVQTIQHETGRVLPEGTGKAPVVVNNNTTPPGVNGARRKPSVFGSLARK